MLLLCWTNTIVPDDALLSCITELFRINSVPSPFTLIKPLVIPKTSLLFIVTLQGLFIWNPVPMLVSLILLNNTLPDGCMNSPAPFPSKVNPLPSNTNVIPWKLLKPLFLTISFWKDNVIVSPLWCWFITELISAILVTTCVWSAVLTVLVCVCLLIVFVVSLFVFKFSTSASVLILLVSDCTTLSTS